MLNHNKTKEVMKQFIRPIQPLLPYIVVGIAISLIIKHKDEKYTSDHFLTGIALISLILAHVEC
jgi:hypothetical protein